MNNENRRQFLQKFGLLSIAATAAPTAFASYDDSTVFHTSMEAAELVSLSSGDIFSVLNLDLPELAKVVKTLEKKGYEKALDELLKYYQARYPKSLELAGSSEYNPGNMFSSSSKISGSKKGAPTNDPKAAVSIAKADDLGQHIFQWGPYKAASYGTDIDWAADPAGDIEWVASVYRFSWVSDLINAYLATGDEKYARIFIELTTDWIKKHPLEKTLNVVHPVYKAGVYGSSGWRGYPWLAIQTGIRATNLCRAFRVFVDSKAFTPQFLGTLIASLYDHQVKTEKMPMNKVHNMAIFEQRGFFNVMHTFPEYRDKDKWLDIGIDTSCIYLLAQTTADGVQLEWCGGYHLGVYRDALEIEDRAGSLGRKMPAVYYERLEAMAGHIFGISTPDLGFPMFGDTARSKPTSKERTSWSLYHTLVEAGEKFNDPKYKALADLDVRQLPSNGSIAFSQAGLYAMRNKWSPDQVYMALHCSLQGYSIHDTPDNGTFELYGYGRWLMPDSGYYTYGHDPEARAWHKQTKVHATMTVNGKDTMYAGRQLLWNSSEDMDVLCVENYSYRFFLHRRTVWFTGKRSNMPFFVIFDEAIGDAQGDIAIHFPMTPGVINIDNATGRINTGFDDANLMIQVVGKNPITLVEEDGWHAWSYGKREKRTSVSAVYKGHGPFTFVSVLVPYPGTIIPTCRILSNPSLLYAGANQIELAVEINGKKWMLERKLWS